MSRPYTMKFHERLVRAVEVEGLRGARLRPGELPRS